MLNLLFIVACDTITSQLKSPEEQLIDLRFEQKQSLEQLYTNYGGGSLNNLLKDNVSAAQNDSDPKVNSFLNNIKTTIQSTDKEVFSEHCLQIGQGHSVSFVTDKAKLFFEEQTTVSTCKEAALRQIRIQQLESSLQNPN